MVGVMTKLCIFVGMLLGSYLGWYLGDAASWGFWGAFLLSGVGSLAGVYVGWKYGQKLDH
jgi:putative Mn2+ efflux pump MntP